MQTQTEWLSYVEIARLFDIQPSKVSKLVDRHHFETKVSPVDGRRRLAKVSDFRRIFSESEDKS